MNISLSDREFLFKINLIVILVINVLVDIFIELTNHTDKEKEIEIDELNTD